MYYKEHFIEDKMQVNLENLKAGFISKEDYELVHKSSIILCGDVLIWQGGGFLLVRRDNVPAKGELWPIGGRMQRGTPIEENIHKKAKAECNLDLKNLSLLGIGRTGFLTDPFNHGKGTDTVNFMYYAEGVGDIKLDSLHSKPTIIDFNKFNSIKDSLHPYVVDFLSLAFKYKGMVL